MNNKILSIEENSTNIHTKKSNEEFLKVVEKKGIKYTKQQKEVVFHKDGPALVLAVPGSGKTTTMIGRIANLILNHNIDPINILAITFSRASAIDMNKRFKNLFGDTIKGEVKFSTIHSFANMVLMSYNKRFNLNLTLLKAWQINHIIKEVYTEVFKIDISDENLEAYVTGISYIKNKMLSEKEIVEYENESELKKIGVILNKYDTLKKERNYYDYDDMLELCLKILNENKVTLEFLREKYKYVLLDEAQDTSLLQYEIIKLLVTPKNNVCLVADDDQLIYQFRGATPEVLLNVNSLFPNAKIYFMEQNFRSTKAIVEVANRVIKNNDKRYKKKIHTEKIENYKSVELVYLKDINNQNEYILKSIENNSNSIALLYRNNLSVIPIANALYSNGIRFNINNYKTTFFNHWIVKDIMNIINLINDPSDKIALSNIYYKIKTYLSKNIINKLLSIDIKGEDVFSFLLSNFSLKEHEYDRILTLKICFEEARKKSVANGVRDILYEISYIQYIEKMNDKSTTIDEVITTLIEILRDVNNYKEANNKILELRHIIENSSNNKDVNVFLSTLHGSKGLEFTDVYLLSMLDSIMPSKNKANIDSKKDEIEDDRRLFYVGITRAKETLKILIPGQNCSLFIDELLKENIDNSYLTINSKNNKTIIYEIEDNNFIDKNKKQSSNNITEQISFSVGDRVIYKKAGKEKNKSVKGIVKEIERDKIKIELEGYGLKMYSLKVLLENNLISNINNKE